MHYNDVIADAFQPSPAGAVAAPTQGASTARRLRDAIEPIAMHSVWSRGTNEHLAGLGYDFFTGYVGSRAALLGSPDPSVVSSSFAVFEPSMIESIYGAARDVSDPRALLAARDLATTASLADVLAEVDPADIAHAADALGTAVGQADSMGRPLFSGLAKQPVLDTAIGRLWRATELAREHRGDSHVAVCVSNGLGPVVMNILTELWLGMPLGSYSATRGWSAAVITAIANALSDIGLLEGDEITDEGRAFRSQIEATTDALEQPIVDALGVDAELIIERLAAWSELCIAAAAFPPNVYKRAAG